MRHFISYEPEAKGDQKPAPRGRQGVGPVRRPQITDYRLQNTELGHQPGMPSCMLRFIRAETERISKLREAREIKPTKRAHYSLQIRRFEGRERVESADYSLQLQNGASGVEERGWRASTLQFAGCRGGLCLGVGNWTWGRRGSETHYRMQRGALMKTENYRLQTGQITVVMEPWASLC